MAAGASAFLLASVAPADAAKVTKKHDRAPGVPLETSASMSTIRLTLDDAFTRAQRFNKSIQATVESRDIAKAMVRSAKAYPNPQFALNYGFGNAYSHVIAGNTQSFGLNQVVEFPGKTINRIRVAKAQEKLTNIQVDQALFDLRIAVRRAYADVAAAEASLELNQTEQKMLAQLLDVAQKKPQTNNLRDRDIMQVQLAVKELEAELAQLQANLQQASSQMDLLIGEDPMHLVDVTDNAIFRLSAEKTDLVPQIGTGLLPPEELIKLAYANRLDVKAAGQQVVTSQRGLSYARAQQVPDLIVGAGYAFSTYTPSQKAREQSGAYLNVNLDLPVFYHHQGEVANAKAVLRQSQKQLIANRAQIETDVIRAYQGFLAEQKQIIKYQAEVVPLAVRSFDSLRKGYEAGEQDMSDVLVSRQQYHQARSDYFDTVVDYQNAWADLEHAVGQPLDLE